MQRIIITGATSGIGFEVAKIYIRRGFIVGVTGRNIKKLEELWQMAPTTVYTQRIDVTQDNADKLLGGLLVEMGGADIYLHCPGVGNQNRDLDTANEIETGEINVIGFMRLVDYMFRYFKQHGGGHIAAITSIAGTRGIGVSPSYSATKRFQSTYIDALAQLSRITDAKVTFSDIKPGFVRTPMVKHPYPWILEPSAVAKKIAQAIDRHKRRIIIDFKFAMIVMCWRMLPKYVWERIPLTSKT
ncbi:MAG: SDR family NAD(P)-dependent oxidoreductase [Marinifilaceae bacterium]